MLKPKRTGMDASSTAVDVYRKSLAAKISLGPLFVIFAAAAIAQVSTVAAVSTPSTQISPVPVTQPVSEKTINISYVAGQLTIHAHDYTLEEILARVGAVTGVKMDLPSGVAGGPMPIVEFGPGPAHRVLASLLSFADLDYVIQGSDANPDQLRSVLLMKRDKSPGNSHGTELAMSRGRSPFARSAAPPQEAAPAPEPVVDVAPEPPPAPEAPPTPPVSQAVAAQPDQSNGLRPGAMTPPPVLNQQSISTQLQQMYQQRMQMIQQDRQKNGN
jgi:hypothetical protein